MNALIGKEKTCPICHKVFIYRPEWVFRRFTNYGEKVFCSWSCLRTYEERRGTQSQQRDKIIQAIYDGLTIREITALLGVDSSRVWYWKKKLERENRENERKTGAEEGDKAD